MILTVTCNPALDCTMVLSAPLAGGVNRAARQTIRCGGKGVNVSAMLRALGLDSTATGFSAGFTGEALEREVRRMGVFPDFVRLKTGLTRVNVKLRGEGETEVNAPGPAPDEEERSALAAKTAALGDGDVLVLAGTVPHGMPGDWYARLLAPLKNRNVLTVVDAEGDLLRTALPCRPFLVKPNREELAALLGAGMESLDDVRAGALRVREMGARNVLVSLGAQGCLLADETGAVRYLPAPDGRVRGAVGSGDSMVAGFLAGWLDRHDYAWAQRMGTAAGSATAFSDGLAGSARVQEVLRTMNEAALSPQE